MNFATLIITPGSWWWQLKCYLCVHPENWGKMNPFLTHIFSDGLPVTILGSNWWFGKRSIMIFITTFYCSICFQDSFLSRCHGKIANYYSQWRHVFLFSIFRESKELSGSPTIPSFFLVPWQYWKKWTKSWCGPVIWLERSCLFKGRQGFGKWRYQWAFKQKYPAIHG